MKLARILFAILILTAGLSAAAAPQLECEDRAVRGVSYEDAILGVVALEGGSVGWDKLIEEVEDIIGIGFEVEKFYETLHTLHEGGALAGVFYTK